MKFNWWEQAQKWLGILISMAGAIRMTIQAINANPLHPLNIPEAILLENLVIILVGSLLLFSAYLQYQDRFIEHLKENNDTSRD